jgi:hypothetical protein
VAQEGVIIAPEDGIPGVDAASAVDENQRIAVGGEAAVVSQGCSLKARPCPHREQNCSFEE